MNEGLISLALKYFPKRLKNIALADAESPDITEEIRLCAGKEATVVKKSGTYFISDSGECTEKRRAAIFSKEEIKEIIKLFCKNSIYSYQDKLRQGFITLEGGHRVGVAGRCISEEGKIKSITDISSLDIRIAKEVKGAAIPVIPYIIGEKIKNCLIISPPGCGKTTMLRDICRILGGERYMKRVALADERGEIASMYDSLPANDIGALTFVMDGCPKYEGMMSLLRSSSPEVMITDEIGSEEDSLAILQAVKSGVSVICSIHATSIDEAMNKEGIKKLTEEKVFSVFVLLGRKNGPGTLEEIRCV